ncbi:phage terminase large subunit family protein [Malikia spinosa]|uniref:phage terminase large subunit family protein n=1 Tax=Malikia spinosa TaxID=86180 RepID=UPI002FDA0067
MRLQFGPRWWSSWNRCCASWQPPSLPRRRRRLMLAESMSFFCSPEVGLRAMARALAPRKALTVSQWADDNRHLSSKGSSVTGEWVTDRNPPLREPMDCLSARSNVRDVVLMFPIQFGKTEVAVNALGYCMDHDPCPVMVCLPGEVSMQKWVAQKLNPAIDESPAMKRALTSVASRDATNTRTFKDFAGGQLYVEHAGSPSRLKSTTVRKLIVDEVDEFANNFSGGDDPLEMLNGRTSAFPTTSQRLYISTPQIKGISRIEQLWLKSDQRRYHVPCPHCGHLQHLEWSGLHWTPDVSQVWYTCQECGAQIDEHHKTAMIAAGQWIPGNPGAKVRGYHINCLYYQFGLGPRWAELAEAWREVQSDPARHKTFMNDRLAEPWEDAAMRAVRHNAIADRAEPYKLRVAPMGVLAVTAGVDTQDNRLAVHITGWGRGMAFWTLDYVELMGDPADDAVWVALTELLNTPIQHECGATLRIEAMANDMGGHRGEAVKAYVRDRRVRRPMVIFGATANNAPVLGKGKLMDVDWRGRVDKRGVTVYQVGTVAAKHWLYGRLSTDADKPSDQRQTHFSQDLEPSYFAGLVSETYNPAKNRFDKRRGARNEPLDTWVYSYAAAHHPELRLHRATTADWDRREAQLLAMAQASGTPAEVSSTIVEPGALAPMAEAWPVDRIPRNTSTSLFDIAYGG